MCFVNTAHVVVDIVLLVQVFNILLVTPTNHNNLVKYLGTYE